MSEPSDTRTPCIPGEKDAGVDAKPVPAGISGAATSLVFCGDPAQVRTGFAIALQLMGVQPMPEVGERDPPAGGK
jgi:hypothetical protein